MHGALRRQRPRGHPAAGAQPGRRPRADGRDDAGAGRLRDHPAIRAHAAVRRPADRRRLPRRPCRATGRRASPPAPPTTSPSPSTSTSCCADRLATRWLHAGGERGHRRFADERRATVGRPTEPQDPRWSTTGRRTCSRWRPSCRARSIEPGRATSRARRRSSSCCGDGLRGDPARRPACRAWTASRPRRHIKQRERTRHIPIIFLTAVDHDAAATPSAATRRARSTTSPSRSTRGCCGPRSRCSSSSTT